MLRGGLTLCQVVRDIYYYSAETSRFASAFFEGSFLPKRSLQAPPPEPRPAGKYFTTKKAVPFPASSPRHSRGSGKGKIEQGSIEEQHNLQRPFFYPDRLIGKKKSRGPHYTW